ncbi:MAG: hypothetical protein LBU25_06305 [Treponema sp.]|nr:hypothetical protein [Treponema sp.]
MVYPNTGQVHRNGVLVYLNIELVHPDAARVYPNTGQVHRNGVLVYPNIE